MRSGGNVGNRYALAVSEGEARLSVSEHPAAEVDGSGRDFRSGQGYSKAEPASFVLPYLYAVRQGDGLRHLKAADLGIGLRFGLRLGILMVYEGDDGIDSDVGGKLRSDRAVHAGCVPLGIGLGHGVAHSDGKSRYRDALAVFQREASLSVYELYVGSVTVQAYALIEFDCEVKAL